jgi:hypothetical protein
MPEVQTITGYIGKNYKYQTFPEKNKTLLATTVKPKTNGWVSVIAWNNLAIAFKESIDDGVKKIKATGKRSGEGNTLIFSDITVFKLLEIEATIAKAQKKISASRKPYTHLFMLNDKPTNGTSQVQTFNVSVWSGTKVHKGIEFKKGARIAIRGESQQRLNPSNGQAPPLYVQAFEIAKQISKLTVKSKRKSI